MENAFKYCVVIRTLGTGGEKYKNLLNSIDSQTIKPTRVFIFIAEGYPLPNERLGYEEFIYTKKGMWHQRVFGMQYVAKKEPDCVQLVCDDDLSFKPDFVEEMYSSMTKYNVDVLIPGSGKYGNFKKNIFTGLLGQRFETSKADFRISITSTGGYIVCTTNKDIMPTQSGQFAIFMIKSSCIHQLNLQEEYWLEETKYALPDDQVFFYKSYLLGLNVMNCCNPQYIHLDHGSSSLDRSINYSYASGRNILIFWHRFLFLPNKLHFFKKLSLIIGIVYRIFINVIYFSILTVKEKNLRIIESYLKGITSSVRFIRSKDYKNIPRINKAITNKI